MAQLLSLVVNGVTRLNNDTYGKNIYADKFIKNGSSDSYVLLGGGGEKAISDFAPASHGVHWDGFTKRTSGYSWGTLTSSNSYTPMLWMDSTNGGGVAFSDKSGQTSMQIDGYFYQVEGAYRVTDVTETVTALGTNGNTITWTKNGVTNSITVPYATKASQDGNGNTISSYYLPLSGGTMTGVITMNTGTGIQMKYTSNGNDPWMYANGAPNYGIRYFESTVDKMALSASGNNNNITTADLCINGNGDGTVTIRGNTIIHANNYNTLLPVKLINDPGQTVLKNTYGLNASYGSSSYGHPTIEYIKAFCKYLLANAAGYTCVGYISPNSRGGYICDVYASGTNASSGLPEHITGHFFQHGGTHLAFGTSYGVWYSWYYLHEGTTYVSSAGKGYIGGTEITQVNNADTVDGQHFSYSNTSNSPTYLWATNSSGTNFLAHRASISVNYASDSDKLDGVHIDGLFTSLANSNNMLSVTIGGVTKTLTVDYSKHSSTTNQVVGTNSSSDIKNALLISGAGRTDSSPAGDTWIYGDSLGATPWGILHEQASNFISFYGAGTRTAYINLSNGYISGTVSNVTVNNSDADATYRVVFHSSSTLYSTSGIYCNASTDSMYASFIELSRTTDHGLKVGSIRGTVVGSRTGQYIHMYERVHIGSPNGWGSNDAPANGLSTYGGAWFAVNDGNVGIGTNSPSYKLHLDGSGIYAKTTNTCGIMMESTHSESSISYKSKGGTRTVLGTYANRFFLWNESIGEHVTVLSANGNLGIGTTSPDEKLHVAGNARIQGTNPALYIRNDNSSADTFSIIRFGTYAGDNQAYIFLNGPNRTADGGKNMMTIRNNVGDLRLDNYTTVTGGQSLYGLTSTCNAGNDASYTKAAVQIREYNFGGAQADTWAIAPRLAWHWAGRVQSQIGLGSDGELYLSKNQFSNAYKLVYETGTWGISITGNATTSSYPAGFTSRGTNDWSGVAGTLATDWSVNGADIMFKYDGSKLNVITDGRFYQGIDIYGASKRVLDEYDITHTKWGDADTLDGEDGSRYTRALGSPNYVTINVGGAADTYYPVVISSVSDYYPMQLVNISRRYSETAPDSWYSSTHKGGLTCTLLWNGSTYWDGNSSGGACYCVYVNQSYSTTLGGFGNSTYGKVVWLRGGGATYHIHAMNGTSVSATVYTSTFTDSASQSFAPTTSVKSYSVRWPGYAEGADYATSATNATNARYVIADNNAKDPGYSLLQSGSGRSDASPSGDTWIYWDTLGGTSSPWGFKHEQADNYISFYGAGARRTYISLSNGYVYAKGFYHLDYGSSAYALTSNGGVAHIGSMSVNYAASAGNADTVDSQHFTYSNSSNSPTYLWGTNSSGSSFLAARGSISVNYANSSGTANCVTSTGFGSGTFTYLQTSGDFYGTSGWAHYLIANHGDGATYYNYVIKLPFWDVPAYKRQTGSTSSVSGWHTFITSENIASQSVSYATSAGSATSASSATNADKVDGYHASGLWRSDGATWNPGANVSLGASGNSQEWSFDITRNGYTGCYWHVWDSALSTMLRVDADNGKVTAPYSMYSAAFYETSDIRFKKFVKNICIDFDSIRSIPKKYFIWTKGVNAGDKLHIGTSAQDIQKIYPELVSEDYDGVLHVAYDKLSIIALAAIDKLHDENQDLKHEINLLKQEIQALKKDRY